MLRTIFIVPVKARGSVLSSSILIQQTSLGMRSEYSLVYRVQRWSVSSEEVFPYWAEILNLSQAKTKININDILTYLHSPYAWNSVYGLYMKHMREWKTYRDLS